jgi:hypothetical protein
VRRQPMPSDGIRTCSVSIDERWRRRDSRRPTSRRRGSWGFGSGSCCAIRSITRNSAVVAWRGSRKRGVCGDACIGVGLRVTETLIGRPASLNGGSSHESSWSAGDRRDVWCKHRRDAVTRIERRVWTSKNCGDEATAASADSLAYESRLQRAAQRRCVLTLPMSLEMSQLSSKIRSRMYESAIQVDHAAPG